MLSPGSALISSGTTSRLTVVFQSAVSSVRE
jgi:hypothetical protein